MSHTAFEAGARCISIRRATGGALVALVLLLPVATPRPTLGAQGPEEAQPEDSDGSTQWRDEPPPEVFSLRRLAYDAKFVYTKPAHLSRRERNLGLALLGATGGLYLLRDEIRDFARRNQSPDRTDCYNDVRDVFGKGATAPLVALGAYLASFATDNPREKETALMLVQSAAYSASLSLGSFVLAAERPRNGDTIDVFDSEGHGVSLDAALAASIVEPLRCQYLRTDPSDGAWARAGKSAASVLLYAGAAFTAYQRIDTDAHWAPDAFLGTMSGLAVGRTLCEAHGKSRRPSSRISAAPLPGGFGVRITLGPR